MTRWERVQASPRVDDRSRLILVIAQDALVHGLRRLGVAGLLVQLAESHQRRRRHPVIAAELRRDLLIQLDGAVDVAIDDFLVHRALQECLGLPVALRRWRNRKPRYEQQRREETECRQSNGVHMGIPRLQRLRGTHLGGMGSRSDFHGRAFIRRTGSPYLAG